MKIRLSSSKSNKWIYVLSMLLLSTLVLPGDTLKTAVFGFVLYTAWITGCAKPSILLMISSVLLNFKVSGTVWVLVTMPAYLGWALLKRPTKKKELVYAIVTLCALGASLVLGEKANSNTLLLFILCFCAYFTLANDPCDENEIKAYALCGLIIVLVALATSITGDHDGLKYGRLSINNNIRELANATAISLMLLMAGMLSTTRKKDNRNVLFYVAAGIGVLILFATLSKGAIIACCVGVLVVFLFSKMPLYQKLIIGVVFAAVVLVVLNNLSQSEALDTQRLTQNDEGFNGRTDIWLTYWDALNRSAGRFLFGFGPGELLRMRISPYYAHSLFFDILCSYGVVGFVLVIGGFLAAWGKILASKKPLAIGLMVFAILLYATHGIANNSSYYIIMGIAAGMVQKNPAADSANDTVSVRE